MFKILVHYNVKTGKASRRRSFYRKNERGAFLFLSFYPLPHLTSIWGHSKVAVWGKDESCTAGRTMLILGDVICCSFFQGLTNVPSWLVDTFVDLGECLTCKTLNACAGFSSCPASCFLSLQVLLLGRVSHSAPAWISSAGPTCEPLVDPCLTKSTLLVLSPKGLLLFSMCPSKSRRYMESQVILMKPLSHSFKCSSRIKLLPPSLSFY